MSNAGKVLRLPASVREGMIVCLSLGSADQGYFKVQRCFVQSEMPTPSRA